MTALAFHNVSKNHAGRNLLEDVSFELAKGESLAIIGADADSKAALLDLIAGIEQPDQGSISIHGQNSTERAFDQYPIGLIEAFPPALSHQSVFRFIAAPLIAKQQPKAEIHQAVTAFAGGLGLEPVLDQHPATLTPTLKLRMMIAQALIMRPELILLDNPLAAFTADDAANALAMRLDLPNLLQADQSAAIYLTDDDRQAMAWGHRILVLHEGRVAQIGTPMEIYRQPANLHIARLFGNPTINLLPASPAIDSSGVYINLAGGRLRLPPHYYTHIAKECIVGIRPEHLSIVTRQTQGAIHAQISAQTLLDEKSITTLLTRDHHQIIVSQPTQHPLPEDPNIAFVAETDAFLLFDAKLSTRLGHDKEDSRYVDWLAERLAKME